jgi:hypothetical protein
MAIAISLGNQHPSWLAESQSALSAPIYPIPCRRLIAAHYQLKKMVPWRVSTPGHVLKVRSCLIEACDDNWQQRFLPIVIGFIGPLSGHMRTMIC